MAEEVTERVVLTQQSDDAYDRAVATPVDSSQGSVNRKTLALLEVLVAEAKLDRYDRENPFELGGLVWEVADGDVLLDGEVI